MTYAARQKPVSVPISPTPRFVPDARLTPAVGFGGRLPARSEPLQVLRVGCRLAQISAATVARRLTSL